MSEVKEKTFKINLGNSALLKAPEKLTGNESDEASVAAYITTGNDD